MFRTYNGIRKKNQAIRGHMAGHLIMFLTYDFSYNRVSGRRVDAGRLYMRIRFAGLCDEPWKTHSLD
jgi:hypothetical protein